MTAQTEIVLGCGATAAASGKYLKEIALNATKVICVAYTNEFSIDNNSLIDMEVGCKYNVVSSNQDVLNRIESGNLVIITSQTRHFVIGIVGKDIDDCNIWKSQGGHAFKYAREFTPITDILPIALVMEAWKSTCDIEEVTKQPKYLFHSRFCGYGNWYINALRSAIKMEIIPTRK